MPMPEMTLIVKWPDGLLQECCAPSLALYDHFAEGVTYTVAHFRSQMLDALDGVLGDARSRLGFTRTSPAATAEQVKAAAARFAASDKVRVISMYPPLKTAAREPQPLRWSS